MKVVHWKQESYTLYIGRPSIYGNPYKIGIDGDRIEVIRKFEVYARAFPQLLESIKELPDYTVLGCWCSPNPCHGDVIIKLWHELKQKDKENAIHTRGHRNL